MCFLENKEEIFVNISSDTYYKLDFCVILNTKYLILNKNSNPKNLLSSPLNQTCYNKKAYLLKMLQSFCNMTEGQKYYQSDPIMKI